MMNSKNKMTFLLCFIITLTWEKITDGFSLLSCSINNNNNNKKTTGNLNKYYNSKIIKLE